MPPRKNTKKTNGVDTENVLTNEPERRTLRAKKVVNYNEEKKEVNEVVNKNKRGGGLKGSEESSGSSSKKTKPTEKVSESIKENAPKTKAKSKVTKGKDDELVKKTASKGKPKTTKKDIEKKLTKNIEPTNDALVGKKKTTKQKEKVTEDSSSKKSKRDASSESISSKSEEKEAVKKSTKRKEKGTEDSSSKKSKRDASPESISSKSEEKEAVKKATKTKRSVSPERAKSPKPAKKLKNKTDNDWSIDYSCSRLSAEDKEPNFKIASWNVDGIRAWFNKDCFDYIEHEKPDVFCIQETKSSYDKLPDDIKSFKGYHQYWSSASKEGYSGVGLFTKKMPINVINGINDEEHDAEGRIITAEFEYYYIISVYVPNSGRGLVTLPKRLDWNKKFLNFINDLNKKKPVIICGDMNVAHQEIDLKNPKTNKKTAGFTQEERDGMTEFLSNGYVDTFRKLYPKKESVYTFWTYMSNSRAKNTGWRIDYFLISEKLVPKVCDNVVRSSIFGSDHCPIVLYMSF